MPTPARFSGGFTNVGPNAPLGQFGMPDPTLWHVYFNDFVTYAAGDWTITTTEAGAGSATEAMTAGPGGLLLITNDDADNDADFFQLPNESFKFVAGKKLFFKTRFKVSDATQSDVVIGLQITDTSPLDVTDGVFFLKADDAATIALLVEKNNANTSTAVGTLVSDTFTELAFAYDGRSSIKVWKDNVHVGTSAVTNLPDDEDLTVSFGIQNGAAAAKTMTLDFILVAQER